MQILGYGPERGRVDRDAKEDVSVRLGERGECAFLGITHSIFHDGWGQLESCKEMTWCKSRSAAGSNQLQPKLNFRVLTARQPPN